MPTPPLPDATLQAAVDAWAACGRRRNEAAAKLGIPAPTLDNHLRLARARGIVPRVAPLRYGAREKPVAPPPGVERTIAAPPAALGDAVMAALRARPKTLDELAAALGCSKGQALDAVEAARARGGNLHLFGDKWSLERAPAPSRAGGRVHEYPSRPDGTYCFGFTSDNHLGSKYERLDALGALYDRFAARGVDRVYNAGNWIDGEAPFNRHDLKVHGWDAQLLYLAEHYPRRPGIVTHAVAGDDHEGWTAQREGVDPGRAAERVMRDCGRDDWIDLGYMEAFVPLVHARSGAKTMMLVAHPGGGSAYAVSYTVQKMVESYDGGEKPAVLLAGHYHKLSYNMIRNVHAIQTGCTQDQTPFMRKKRIFAHVGGGICDLEQDPRTGAIVACKVEFFPFFVRGYYNDRWSHGGPVVLADRGGAVADQV